MSAYEQQAEEARREAQVVQEMAEASEGFAATALLDTARQLREKADRFDGYAAQEREARVKALPPMLRAEVTTGDMRLEEAERRTTRARR
jgi:hypothetical protein